MGEKDKIKRERQKYVNTVNGQTNKHQKQSYVYKHNNIHKHLPVKTNIQIKIYNNRQMHAHTSKKLYVTMFLVFVCFPIYLFAINTSIFSVIEICLFLQHTNFTPN